MSGDSTVSDRSAFERGSLGIQIMLAIVTLGFYTLYWTYSTARQLDDGTDASLTPILAFVPLLNVIALWQISDAAEAVTDQSKIVLFVLFLFVPPLSWYWVQSGMNDVTAN
ncbi:DUF4234 domain-containing protein [Halosolutus amylolyticus]|uniref:DUF4234 domain-containing protein n=1 Tax=Halosolutus amylolyticus TaxID=2932267 RepID=A0ABD5PK13_9EURY|nr:DUF4234 domain-containing protein [Halosolutus amylolyticus]